MAFVAIPNTSRVDVVGFDLAGFRPIVNTFGVKTATPQNEAALADVAGVFRDWYCNHPGSYPDTMSWSYVRATALDTATSPQALVDATYAGTAGPGYPNMAGVYEFFTATRGRSYRGRVFIPIDQGSTLVEQGQADSGWLSGFGTILGDVVTNLAGMALPGVLAVISRKLAEAAPVTELVGREVLGFIRRRLDG